MTVTLTQKVKFYESVFGSGRMARNCKNFDVRCPICDPRDSTKKKLAIHVEDDKVHCWVCGYKAFNLVPLIRKFGTYNQLIEYRHWLPENAKGNYLWNNDVQPRQLTLPKDFKLLATYTGNDPDVKAIKRYLTLRNVDDDDMWYFKLGCSDESKWRRRVIVPSFDKAGNLNHYVGRSIDKYKKPKYETPEGERKQVIFNELNIDWSSRLVLCEGTFDMMKCGCNVVPLLGSDLNETSALFSAIVINNTPIALALDADMKLTKTPEIAKKLLEYNIDVLIVDVCSDPGDMSKKDFQYAYKNARPFMWEESFFERLERAARITL